MNWLWFLGGMLVGAVVMFCWEALIEMMGSNNREPREPNPPPGG